MYPFPKTYSPLLTLSDHTPLIYNTGEIAGNILTWNILVKCKFNQKNQYFNNGFGVVETTDEYHIRLKYIAKEIAEFIKTQKIGIISLQEMPKSQEDIEYFMYLLEENLNYNSDKFLINKDCLNVAQGNFLIFDKYKFSVQNLTYEFSLGTKLKAQTSNFQYFLIKNKAVKERIVLINTHFSWYKPESKEFYASISDIRTIMETAAHFSSGAKSVIMCGDFNLDLENTDLSRDYTIYVERDTTLTHKYDRNLQVLETVDGFVIL